jgi:hypothetical protein
MDIVFFLPCGIFYMAERSRINIVFRSLPIAPSRFILSKYLSVWILLLGGVLYGVGFQIVSLTSFSRVYLATLEKLGFYTVFYPALLWFVAASATYAFVFPIVFRFGTLCIPIIGFTWLILQAVLAAFIHQLPKLGLPVHSLLWIPLFTLFILLIFVLSYCWTLYWFRERDL